MSHSWSAALRRGLSSCALIAGTAVACGLATPGSALAASAHLGQRTLHQGESGHDVRVLQQYLTFSGFPTTIDGSFGPTTLTNVKKFELRYKLPETGLVNARFVTEIRQIVADRKGTAAVASSTGGAALTAPTTGAPTGTPTGTTSTGTVTGGTGTTTTGTTGTTTTTTPGATATLVDGLAVAPDSAPQVVKDVIANANQIATKPYVYGGGHGGWYSKGYDCSGSTSYALHGGNLIAAPEVSGDMESYGSAGPGQWITLWANAGHVYMQIAGLWFDTAAQSSANGEDRWSTTRVDSATGYVERHPTGY